MRVLTENEAECWRHALTAEEMKECVWVKLRTLAE